MGTRTKGGKKSASLVIFSGMDCSGKSTQISALMESFKQRGERPIYIWLRVGYTPLFNAMKSLLRRLAGSKRLPAGEVAAAGSLYAYRLEANALAACCLH